MGYGGSRPGVLLLGAVDLLHVPVVVPEDKGEEPVDDEPKKVNTELTAEAKINVTPESLENFGGGGHGEHGHAEGVGRLDQQAWKGLIWGAGAAGHLARAARGASGSRSSRRWRGTARTSAPGSTRISYSRRLKSLFRLYFIRGKTQIVGDTLVRAEDPPHQPEVKDDNVVGEHLDL